MIKKFLLVVLIVLAFVGGAFFVRFDPLKFLKEEEAPVGTRSDVAPLNPTDLNSRFSITKLDQSVLLDLDGNNEKDEAFVIFHYEDPIDSVFIYYGFYRFDPSLQKWQEIHADGINILNVSDQILTDALGKTSEDTEGFKRTFIDGMTTKLTSFENVGDITGDGCPEILIKTLLQRSSMPCFYHLVGIGPDNFRFKVSEGDLPGGDVIIEDNKVVETYRDTNGKMVKVTKEWKPESLYFKEVSREFLEAEVPAGEVFDEFKAS